MLAQPLKVAFISQRLNRDGHSELGASFGCHPVGRQCLSQTSCGGGRSGYRWYVRVPVPMGFQELLRKRTIEHSLNTSDLDEARKLKHSALADIFVSFERARARSIASADIEHEAQRHLRQRLEQIPKQSDDTFTMLTDTNGSDPELAGDMVLTTLREELEQEDWSASVMQEADKIARQYGATLTESQRDELCRVAGYDLSPSGSGCANAIGFPLSPVQIPKNKG